jgi:hypothetical protein
VALLGTLAGEIPGVGYGMRAALLTAGAAFLLGVLVTAFTVPRTG